MIDYQNYAVDIDTDNIVIADGDGSFKIEIELCPHEPFSWGESRGDYAEITALLLNLNVNGMSIDRKTLIKIVDDQIICAYEESIAEKYRTVNDYA